MDVFFQRKENLIRINRFYEIIRYFLPHRLVHDVFLLAFRNHNNRRGRKSLLDARKHFKTAKSGHVFVEHYKVIPAVFAHFQRVNAVSCRVNIVSLVFEKDYMGAQKVYLIINPQKFSVLHPIIFSVCEYNYF